MENQNIGNGQKPDERKNEEEQKDITKIRLQLTKRHYVTLSVLATVLLALIGLGNTYVIKPLKRENQRITQKLKTRESEYEQLQSELSDLQKTYNHLMEATNQPILQSPIDQASLIGAHITFKWDYKHHTQHQRYILELRQVGQGRNESSKYFNVTNPHLKQMHFLISTVSYGEFLWRIIPGYKLETTEVYQGPASPYRHFAVYPSIVVRIENTKKIRVGVSPSFSNVFKSLDENGNLKGFDIDLVKWIGEKLSQKLNVRLKVELNETSWNLLLPKLHNYEFDLVISSMTSTQRREEKHRGIKFTEGYFESHHIFFRKKPLDSRDFPSGLKGKVVGVTKGTTDQRVAHFLSKKFKFKVKDIFLGNADVFKAVIDGEVDFGISEDVLALDHLNERLYQYGPDLDDNLKLFYQQEYGRDGNLFAIAVVDENLPNASLLLMIDQILTSEEGQQKLEELTKTWVKSKTGTDN